MRRIGVSHPDGISDYVLVFDDACWRGVCALELERTEAGRARPRPLPAGAPGGAWRGNMMCVRGVRCEEIALQIGMALFGP